MELREFREELIDDIRAQAEANMEGTTSAFIQHITSLLVESEEVEDFTECYFEMKRSNRKIQIDGFHFDEFDNSCVIFLCDFTNEIELETLNNTLVDSLYNRMKAYVESAIDGYIRKNGEESSLGYDLATQIEDEINNISKFRFYILTDRVIGSRVKNLKKDPIGGKEVDLNIWDITRVYNVALSKMGKESIEINFRDYSIRGIPSVKAVTSESEQYEAYLAVIPGNILADIYLEYGARLLEGNVRSFLSVRGKVNKDIRKTILDKPEMFFAFNNGIAATATEIKYEKTDDGLMITEVIDLQIINGGQTTASIANVVLQDKKDVSNVFVPMKLSVVSYERSEEIVPIISRCANSQNKVEEADFFSNSPFHIRMEDLSRKTFAPPTGGNQYQTIWFYERARGQHVQEQMKLTPSQRKQYLLRNPKGQVIKKVDLAKYMNTYWRRPHEVSKGAQASMRTFAKSIEAQWKKSDVPFNAYFFKKAIAIAIIFKETERLVSNQQWYKVVKAYRANIVTYSLAVIFEHIRNLEGVDIDFRKIWNQQGIYNELSEQLIVTTKEVYDFITRDDRPTQNVTEWCKKEACWKLACQQEWTFLDKFIKTLISKDDEISEQTIARKEQTLNNDINAEIEVIQMGSIYWQKIRQWGVTNGVLTPVQNNILQIACNYEQTGMLPTAKQAKIILDVRKKLYKEGMPEIK